MANIENIRKWVAALRSGEYSQTKKVLRDDHGFCCLGVACDVYAKEYGLEWESIKRPVHYESGAAPTASGYHFNGVGDLLPDEVYEWLGLDGPNPEVNRNVLGGDGGFEYADQLTYLNDDAGADFDVIAAAIEKEFL